MVKINESTSVGLLRQILAELRSEVQKPRANSRELATYNSAIRVLLARIKQLEQQAGELAEV